MDNQIATELVKLQDLLLDELDKRTTNPDDFSRWREYILKELERSDSTDEALTVRIGLVESSIIALKVTPHGCLQTDKLGEIQVQVGKMETVLQRLDTERGRFWGKVGGIAAILAVIISALALIWSIKG